MLLKNAKIATMAGETPYGLIEKACLSIKDGVIDWVGPEKDLPLDLQEDAEDLGGRLITPGLVDCHTHIVFGGNRAAEFELRLNGASYEEVARAGGGIVSTVKATRGADHEALLQDALKRVDSMIAEGVTTVEIKSGYGLDIETELRMLRVARSIEAERDIRVKTSFLGAHAVPDAFKGRAQDYLNNQCIPALKKALDEGLVDAVDGFCEGIAFTSAEIETVFQQAQALGLPVKLHAEQLSHSGGVQLACRYGALSVDHVEYATDEDAQTMAQSGAVAVLLPGAFYTLRETQLPPISGFRNHGVPMALATDCNPGSSPMASMLLTMNMGCTLFRMTPAEALAGATKHGARALGLSDCGAIEAGSRADLAIWDVEHPAELAYRIGFNPLYRRVFGGKS